MREGNDTMNKRNDFASSALRSNMQRRDMLKLMGAGAAALSFGGMAATPAMAAEATVAFWATATLDIGDKWPEFARQSGVSPEFTDNGNDVGPVVARLAAGNANDLFDIGGFQGGAERELAKQGLIAPWDVSKIPNFAGIWQWAKDIPTLTYEGKQYGIPTVVNADSIIYRADKLGKVDSYGVIFDPKLKGRVAMEDAWINSAIFTAIYLKGAENKPIKDPGNLTESELGLVMEFLIKHKKDGQFRTFWNGWEQGVQLVANEEVDAMTGWEPIVYEGRKRGLQVEYAAPVEGYEGWGNNTVLLKGAAERGKADVAHKFVDGLLAGLYGCELGKARGYLVPTDNNLAYAKAHPDEYKADDVAKLADHVKAKFSGKVYWQNCRPDNFQLYEEWWQKLRNA
ncbi:spermidine/putrescine-binding protein periplasmic protein-like protein substrate-binding protein [Rhizobium freirei PRF 81]|uniref:Spermidine/putrescine-binding protein periplasmic protein-like protein substrate-binding protein n=2 Tax=Rhizobium freirei TaxID=1353277 RepID=N6UW20_9HYPH|nr:spermidine/putrescine-binding protein periplasmic protein-like protein substrate-binding protein [Rhizobium freirei PRF 81]